MEEAAALRAEYQEKQHAIANVVAIQAWWRGVAFRAGIGAKRKKEKKGKKGRKKKKGKKGKVGKSKKVV